MRRILYPGNCRGEGTQPGNCPVMNMPDFPPPLAERAEKDEK
jgi:hypothetical protein